ncbi:MAG: NAD(P)/FAD-dependent oxidoreductase [Bacteroidales bacterium]|nr:NAD(P)/FAD-dependent oxidoreductase [Bacteroidales bacterium]MBN2762716.1 NAD(P)/FAD-dependent oxidoreductase [Bacteroidales bacterium]
MKYDVVIIGSGLGGLQCAYILSREGYNVCLAEKNPQLGGCLQTFKRNNSLFDTGMHYIGSMDKGQVLDNFFRYFRLSGRLNLRRMDENGYEIIQYGEREYKLAMGYERFVETLLSSFPKEKEALSQYIHKLKEISNSVDLYNMRDFSGQKTGYLDYYSVGINDYLDAITTNKTLKNVLLGTSPLYAGVKNRTPLYIPMIIHSSYIESAYRFVDGGSQISDLLAGYITEYGGTIMKNARVTKLLFDNQSLKAVEINNSERIEGKYFISNIHPKSMFDLFDNAPLRPAYHKRINSLEDTFGIFSLYLSMKENAFEYINSNYYVFKTDDIWDGDNYTQENWPKGYMMHISPTSKSDKYTDAIIINTYMNWDEVRPWEKTVVGRRGESYKAFKHQKAEKLLDLLEKDFPGIRSKTAAYYTSTPLTYRDYTGTYKGSIYGLMKDFNNPLKTMIMPRTKVPNFLLTGQNINIHGVIGVTIGSVLTCAELIGTENLLTKLRNA